MAVALGAEGSDPDLDAWHSSGAAPEAIRLHSPTTLPARPCGRPGLWRARCLWPSMSEAGAFGALRPSGPRRLWRRRALGAGGRRRSRRTRRRRGRGEAGGRAGAGAAWDPEDGNTQGRMSGDAKSAKTARVGSAVMALHAKSTGLGQSDNALRRNLTPEFLLDDSLHPYIDDCSDCFLTTERGPWGRAGTCVDSGNYPEKPYPCKCMHADWV